MKRTRRVQRGGIFGLGVNDRDGDGFTKLYKAVRNNNLPEVQALLRRGADVNLEYGRFNVTVLHIASKNGNVGIVNELLMKNSNLVYKQTANGAKPIDYAAENCHIEVFKGLADMDNNFNANDLLYRACDRNCLEIVKYLVEEKGADINSIYSEYSTPLIYSIHERKKSIVEYLLEHGADPNLIDPVRNISPLHKAVINRDPDSVELLLEHGADISLRINNRTPLQLAESGPYSSVIIFNILTNWGGVAQPPQNVLNVPEGAENAVFLDPIQEGNNMVNFHGERALENPRYYKESTYRSFSNPKRNPFTRQLINHNTIRRYKARVVPAVQEEPNQAVVPNVAVPNEEDPQPLNNNGRQSPRLPNMPAVGGRKKSRRIRRSKRRVNA